MPDGKTGIKARPTLYKGIQMRSRLEASFAAFLDQIGADWAYEPTCFAGPNGQWLPDFRMNLGECNVYVEVKPDSLEADPGVIDPILERMTTTWLSEPTALLQLVIWPFGGDPHQSISIMGFPPGPEGWDDALAWWISRGSGSPTWWHGMGQLHRKLLATIDALEARNERVSALAIAEMSRDEHGLTALITDADVITACGITPERTWWCDCGTRADGDSYDVLPPDVCDHLYVLGMASEWGPPEIAQ